MGKQPQPTSAPSPIESGMEPSSSKGSSVGSLDALAYDLDSYAQDVDFLRSRGCKCHLFARAGMAAPFTVCEEDGNRAICPKRLISSGS